MPQCPRNLLEMLQTEKNNKMRQMYEKKKIMQLNYVKARFCYASHSIPFFYNKASFNLHGDSNICNRSDDGDIQARIN